MCREKALAVRLGTSAHCLMKEVRIGILSELDAEAPLHDVYRRWTR
jgi:hypothetical protein